MVYRILTATVLTTFTVCSCGYSSGEENTPKRIAEAKKLLEKTNPEKKSSPVTPSTASLRTPNKASVTQAFELLNTVEAPKQMPPEVAPKSMSKQGTEGIKKEVKQIAPIQCDYFTLITQLKAAKRGTRFIVLNRDPVICSDDTCLSLGVSETRKVYACDIPGEFEKAVFECWIENDKPVMQKIMGSVQEKTHATHIPMMK